MSRFGEQSQGMGTHTGHDQPDDVGPEVDQHGDDGAELDDGGERRDRLVVDVQVEQLLGDGEVAGAGDGQELGEALDPAQDRSLEVVQLPTPARSRAAATVRMTSSRPSSSKTAGAIDSVVMPASA